MMKNQGEKQISAEEMAGILARSANALHMRHVSMEPLAHYVDGEDKFTVSPPSTGQKFEVTVREIK